MTNATLASATNNANKQLINTLLHSRLFRDYENVFTRATGLALALRPLEYWYTSLSRKPARIGSALYSRSGGRRSPCACSRMRNIIRHTGAIPCTEICPFGLTETAVPVRLGEKTIGFLRIGQILRRSAILFRTRRASPPG